MLGFGAIGGSALGAAPFSYQIPAGETKEGKERLRAYYEALGRFVDMFARVETAITLTLWHYAKAEPEIAKIVFSGSTIDAQCTYIKQLSVVTGATEELRNDLGDVLRQLTIIKGVRNKVLHYGAASVAEGNAIVSDALRAKGEPESFPISPTLLGQMTHDLTKIAAHLNELHVGRRSEHTILGDPKYSEWQYRHPTQTKNIKARRAPVHSAMNRKRK